MRFTESCISLLIFRFLSFFQCVKQGSSNLFLEGRWPAEFSSNLPQHTCLEVSSIPSKTLISCFRCVWLGLELNSARHRPSRTELGDPWCKALRSGFHHKQKVIVPSVSLTLKVKILSEFSYFLALCVYSNCPSFWILKWLHLLNSQPLKSSKCPD